MTKLDWVTGDLLGLDIPAHADALREGGAEFLTRAFRATGALRTEGRVERITEAREMIGGSTGRKLLLAVDYAGADDLPTELFVKFSRDFDSALRDRGKEQLELEVRFGLLSREPGFPIDVPACLFADYHHESGTGLLITARVPFGQPGVERPYDKCMDDEVPDAIGHYRAVIAALGRLAGTHKAGRLPGSVAAQFPFDREQAMRADPIRYSAEQLDRRIARYAEFTQRFPGLLPDNICTPEFIAQMHADVPRLLAAETMIKRFLQSDPAMIALCHWNAHLDNAWFWRDADGTLHCGLMDWGRVGQMNVAVALWGALSAAEVPLWNAHLDELLALFADECARAGGPELEPATIRLHLALHVAMMGLAWLMDGPALIAKLLPDMEGMQDRHDPRLRSNESARSQLHMLTTFLNLWQTAPFGGALDALERLNAAEPAIGG